MGRKLRIFISYSRKDSEFVDRLDADLSARGFETWLDRKKLGSGTDWEKELRKAIRKQDIFLVVLSPDSMISPFVQDEIIYAITLNKQFFPVLYRQLSDTLEIPMRINRTQWSLFESRDYEEALLDLTTRLSDIQILENAPISDEIEEITSAPLEFEPITPQQEVNPNLDLLFDAGVAAKAQGDLDHTLDYWQRILTIEPNYRNGFIAQQVSKISQQAIQVRLQRLYHRADEAHQSGEWGKEIGTWKAVLAIEPNSKKTKERLALAQHNQVFEWLYQQAIEACNNQETSVAQEKLKMLWENAPQYGDPQKIATALGIHPKNIGHNPIQKREYQKDLTQKRLNYIKQKTSGLTTQFIELSKKLGKYAFLLSGGVLLVFLVLILGYGGSTLLFGFIGQLQESVTLRNITTIVTLVLGLITLFVIAGSKKDDGRGFFLAISLFLFLLSAGMINSIVFKSQEVNVVIIILILISLYLSVLTDSIVEWLISVFIFLVLVNVFNESMRDIDLNKKVYFTVSSWFGLQRDTESVVILENVTNHGFYLGLLFSLVTVFSLSVPFLNKDYNDPFGCFVPGLLVLSLPFIAGFFLVFAFLLATNPIFTVNEKAQLDFLTGLIFCFAYVPIYSLFLYFVILLTLNR